MVKYTKDHQRKPESEEKNDQGEYEKEQDMIREMDRLKETTMKPKDVPDYKKVYEQMKQDPEIGWLMKTEGYEKASIVILYQILEELRKK